MYICCGKSRAGLYLPLTPSMSGTIKTPLLLLGGDVGNPPLAGLATGVVTC